MTAVPPRRSLLVMIAFPLLSCLACGGSPGDKGATAAGAGPSATSSPASTFFPLREGNLFHYVTEEGGETGMLVARVHRTDDAHAELRMSNVTKRFVVSPEGVAYAGGAYLLKAPLDLGAAWPGEHGGTTRVDAVDAEVTVPAGRFAGCVRTVEEGGRPPGSRYASTYCPGVGIVLLEVASGGGQARAALKSHGPPVRLE
jgi:hypothetical protein